ncbi:MAG: hypothetical protein EX263_09455 [Flavobacteriaceae bacterium]|nr:MAG: hypothetical protein EX263_09455 [Flavobacteriaceae bacterium]
MVCLCFSISVAAQDYLNFTVTNNTGVDLQFIHVSESNKNYWGKDLIPDDVFLAGDTFIVSLPITKYTICAHDMKVTDFEDDYAILEGVNLCKYDKITLYFDRYGTLTWSLEVSN